MRTRVRIVTVTRHSAYFYVGMVCCIRRNSVACFAPASSCPRLPCVILCRATPDGVNGFT
ncbi:MAG TPA: hypothetical protein PKA58_03040 [Polyangium sp.]|nr:hypothetical protein [Polyangium sp.]